MEQGGQKLSAPRKRLLACLAMALAAVSWEGFAAGAGPPPPLGDPLLCIALLLLCALPLCRLRVGPFFFLALLGGLAAHAPPIRTPTDAPSPPGDRDRVLITIDTLRADRALALGTEWRVYDQAVAPSSWTLPSMLSLMSGLPVRRHRGGLPVDQSFSQPENLSFLAERIEGRSAAFVCNPYLRASFGFDRGFDRFEHADDWRETFSLMHALRNWRKRAFGGVERQRHERDAHLVDEAVRWWTSNPSGRFLWVHLLMPHEYERDPHGPAENPEQAYESNVAATQELVDRLLAVIERDALVVLTSDHGEALGEGGRWGHGHSFDDEQVLVPLAIRGVEPGHIDRQVSLTDLAEVVVSGDTTSLDRGREVVELGGLHREVAWAARIEGGALLERSGPAPSSAPPLDPELRSALRALGYE